MSANQSVSLMFVYAETPLHPGTGSSLGIVDLPVQRERTTSYPLIQSSAIKGVLRAMGRERANGDLAMLFGSDKQEYAGAMSFSDARILLFPVRSLAGVFCWISCPGVLARLQRDATMSGQSLGWNVPPNPPKTSERAGVLVTANSEAVVQSNGAQVVLEEYQFTPQENPEVTKIAEWLAANALPTSPEFGWWREKLSRSLVVLHDDDFRDFVTTATEVVARTRLNSETKTVTPGGLWYQEFLPAETMFYSLALAQPSRDKDKVLDADGVLSRFKKLEIGRLQIGGDETTGKGFCSLRYS